MLNRAYTLRIDLVSIGQGLQVRGFSGLEVLKWLCLVNEISPKNTELGYRFKHLDFLTGLGFR